MWGCVGVWGVRGCVWVYVVVCGCVWVCVGVCVGVSVTKVGLAEAHGKTRCSTKS